MKTTYKISEIKKILTENPPMSINWRMKEKKEYLRANFFCTNDQINRLIYSGLI